MSDLMAALVIARCHRCGRGFVWLNAQSDMTDHYAPQNDPGRQRPCGGAIEMLQHPEPNNDGVVYRRKRTQA